jgi:predicted acyltransferase
MTSSTSTQAPSTRWDAIDVLRALTIILMLLNLAPGSWEFNYGFLEHAKWEGWTLIDMVAPAFLFCIGAAMPLSLERRSARGATTDAASLLFGLCGLAFLLVILVMCHRRRWILKL